MADSRERASKLLVTNLQTEGLGFCAVSKLYIAIFSARNDLAMKICPAGVVSHFEWRVF
jgi:hypothetical protein